MATKRVAYKGKRINIIVEIEGAKHLFLDGDHIPVEPRKRGKTFWSKHLPYREFSALEDLGRAIVDYRALDQQKKPPTKTR